MNSRITLAVAAAFGMLAVVLGAFGAHSLEDMLIATKRLDVYKTAVAYQFYHVFALLATGILMISGIDKKLGYAAWCFVIGIILFSGSLYLICILDIRSIGIITQIGGVFFVAGWLMLLFSCLKNNRKKKAS
jgi:uncharacterized membrane protein YgdD (TMEM256/DUF423 family)